MAEFQAITNAPADHRPTVLIITDGKMGDLAQCRGVAGRLNAETQEITIQPSKLADWIGTTSGDRAFTNALDARAAPADIALASGRRAAPYLKAVKAKWGDNVLTVFLKDPRTGTQAADLIWVPTHDKLRGRNVITTDTGPHVHTAERQASAARDLRTRLTDFPRPWLGVVLGGRAKKVRYEPTTAERLIEAITVAGRSAGSVLITPSRRTPAILIDRVADLPVPTWVWDGTSDNPYPGMLGACDAFLVTGDSHNMVSEVLSTGKHTMVFRPAGLPKKFTSLLDRMESEGHITPPGAPDFAHTHEPIDATPVIAAAITKRLADRTPGA